MAAEVILAHFDHGCLFGYHGFANEGNAIPYSNKKYFPNENSNYLFQTKIFKNERNSIETFKYLVLNFYKFYNTSSKYILKYFFR